MISLDAGQRLPDGAPVAVLVNPSAGRAARRATFDHALQTLRTRYRVQLHAPSSAVDLTAIAKAAAETAAAIIVVGGDGTVHHVINAIADRPCPIGLLPLGTGNDLARTLGLPRRTPPAIDALMDGHVRPIDLVEINGRLCATVGVIGLGASATLAYNQLVRPGSLGRLLASVAGGLLYRLAGLQVLLRGHGLVQHADITVDGVERVRAAAPVHAIFIANGLALGGGMTLPVASRIDDGAVDLIWVAQMRRSRLLVQFARLAQGWPIADGVVATSRGRRAVVTCSRPTVCAADGEVVAEGTRFEIGVRPAALHVIAPPA